jgi:hypothetical protein
MLKAMTTEQARRIAALAKAARAARDAFLGNVPESDFGEPPVSRGEQNPTRGLGLSNLPPDAPPLGEFHDAINALSDGARAELFALARIGQTELAAGSWDSLLAEAAVLGDQTVAAALLEDPDLHDHVVKGLYELKAA